MTCCSPCRSLNLVQAITAEHGLQPPIAQTWRSSATRPLALRSRKDV